VPSGSYPGLGDLTIRLPDGTETNGRVLRAGHAASESGDRDRVVLSGAILGRTVHPHDTPAATASFLLPNFVPPVGQGIADPIITDPVTGYRTTTSRAGRVVLDGGGWVVTLDNLDRAYAIKENLDESSGFGVTQTGRIERGDGAPFIAEELEPLIDALQRFLSFCAGRWTGPCLLQGYGPDGRRVWEVWDRRRVSPFHFRLSWHDYICGDQLEQAFPGFMSRWADEGWRQVLDLAIHWYVEANSQAGSVEGSIVMTQTAQEMLSSAVFVEFERWLSADGFERLTAEDRVRSLMRWAGVPTDIPAELGELIAVSRAENWMDIPAAIAGIRNPIAHPTPRNRQRSGRHSPRARAEVWAVGLWVLELCLLRLLGYRGSYANRITRRYTGQVEPVPWSPARG
jgi:hypothetical protein